VMSSFTSFVWKRSVGVIGRNDLIGILSPFSWHHLHRQLGQSRSY
jgi:hypothetical protein